MNVNFSKYKMWEKINFLFKKKIGLLYVIAMGSEVLFLLMPRLLLYSAGSGVNRVQVVLSGFSVRLFCLFRQTLYVGMVVCIAWLHSCLCVLM